MDNPCIIHGYQWIIHGCPWIIHGCPWDINEYPWTIYGYPWISLTTMDIDRYGAGRLTQIFRNQSKKLRDGPSQNRDRIVMEVV